MTLSRKRYHKQNKPERHNLKERIMKTNNDDCCKGCLAGKPGGNKACQAKHMLKAMNENREAAITQENNTNEI